jgi:hypothetical protein
MPADSGKVKEIVTTVAVIFIIIGAVLIAYLCWRKRKANPYKTGFATGTRKLSVEDRESLDVIEDEI